MFGFLRRLFRRHRAPEPGSLVEELWAAEFAEGKLAVDARRFLEADEESHRARYAPEGLTLELRRPDLFAWTEAPLYRHGDFVLQGRFAFPDGAPYCAAGFLFRYQDESNFYAALVSNRGYLRLDAVFNGSPRSLVAWTELEDRAAPDAAAGGGADGNREGAAGSAVEVAGSAGAGGAGARGAVEAAGSAGAGGAASDLSLTIIARGSHLILVVNGRWAAEAIDETFRAGQIAFAGQRFGEEGPSTLALRGCSVDSRPMEVETWYYRWNFYIEPDPRARYRLAQTYFTMGEYLAAAVQLRKNERRGQLGPDELFLKAEVALRLELYDEAEASLEACLAADPARREALDEKANLLYLQSRFTELRSWLEKVAPTMPDNPRLAGLAGHACFALGDYAAAAREYGRAADLEPEQPLFRMNEARSWDQAGRKSEAAAAYLGAARLFFRQEAEDDLALALHRLAALRPRSPEVKELRAKTLFRQGKKKEASKLLTELVAGDSLDSAVPYLLGILRSEEGKRAEALGHFERAAQLEPEYPLYAFRIAETRFMLDLDCREALARAMELAPDDGWVLNLAGQEALGRGDTLRARSLLEAACAALPAAPEPAANLAELENIEGRVDRALEILSPFPDNAACRNQAGNVHAAAALRVSGEESEALLERAIREYERACRIDSSRSEFQTNLAAAYMRLERYTEAETRIRAALDAGGDARAYLLAGELGTVYGDSVRAEAAYRLGLELSPEEPDLLLALGRHYLAGRERKKVEDLRRRLELADPETAKRFAAEIEAATMESLACASCGREWKVPRDLPAQSGSSIRAMPPDESPAGACPTCGKLFCIACRKTDLVDNRFTCPTCGETLKLSDNRLRWLVREHLKRVRSGVSSPAQGPTGDGELVIWRNRR